MNDLLINLTFSNFIAEYKTNFDLNVLEYDCLDLKNSAEGRVLSNYGGWQSKTLKKSNLSPNSVILNLFDLIEQKSKILLQEFGLKNENIDVEGWININEKHNFNKIHTHPKSVISGVFYVKVPENSGQIVFVNPNPLVDVYLMDKVEKSNQLNSGLWKLTPIENWLLFFPSWLSHYVLPNESDETRISIAFNIGVK